MAENQVLDEGISLYKKEKYTDALAFFLSLPDNNGSDSIELAYYIGLCYAKLKHYDDALLYLEQVVTSESSEDRVLQCRFLLAAIYAMSGRKRLADFELKKLLETGYKKSSVYSALGFVAWQQDDVEGSLEYYKKAISEDDKNASALNGMGYVLACENKDLTKSLSYCKKALSMSPNSAAFMDSLGWVYLKLGLLEDARKYLYAAKEKLPENEEILEHIRILELG